MTKKIAAIFRLSSHKKSGAEHGQSLVLFAAGLVFFLGLVGLSIDVGQIVRSKTDAQKVADAAALAGAQDLTNASAATVSAQTYVKANGADVSDATVTISKTNSNNDTIEVTVNRKVNYTFLKALGMSGTTVSARAKVRVASFSGGSGLLPWGFVATNNSNSTLLQNPCFDGFKSDGKTPIFKTNTSCTIKYGAGGGQAQGDFGALALDATGVSTYKDAIVNGSQKKYSIGDEVEAQTGNFGTNTKNALNDRLNNAAPAGCATKSDVMTWDPNSQSYSINPDCYGHPRLGLVPVVDKINNPEKSTIISFAFIWIEGVTNLPGGQQSVQVQFLTLVGNIPNAYYEGDGTGDAKTVKLVE